MLGTAPYPISEWEWFKLQLRLRVLELRGPKYVTTYVFKEDSEAWAEQFPEALIDCWFWCDTTEKLLKKKASRNEHLKFYPSWVGSEQQSITEIVERLPTLSNQLDLKKHILYTILHDYGMGSTAVCHFYGGKVHWMMPCEFIPE